MMKFFKKMALFLALIPCASFALQFNLPTNGNALVGQVQTITLQPSDTFFSISRKYNIGYEALVNANPHVDPFKNRKAPIPFIIPSRFILPPLAWHGIIINIAEMKLYYFPENSNSVYIFPIGVGRRGWATPTGQTFVLQKIKNPYWHVPDSIREDEAKTGTYLPAKVAPGPQDPLGDFALRLNIPGYLIHGTNNPDSIGARVSSGCIRMYPESIEQLFNLVATKEQVHIIDAPYKIGIENGKVYLEAHQPMENNQIQEISNVTPILQAILADTKNLKAQINWHLAAKVAEKHMGIPEPIGTIEQVSNNSPVPENSPAAPEIQPATAEPPHPALSLPDKPSEAHHFNSKAQSSPSKHSTNTENSVNNSSTTVNNKHSNNLPDDYPYSTENEESQNSNINQTPAGNSYPDQVSGNDNTLPDSHSYQGAPVVSGVQ